MGSWEELSCTARSRLIPDKSTLQNHYVEINIDRSHQYSRYWSPREAQDIAFLRAIRRCHSGLYAQLYIFADARRFYVGTESDWIVSGGCVFAWEAVASVRRGERRLIIPDVIPGRNYKGCVYAFRVFSGRTNTLTSFVCRVDRRSFLHLIFISFFIMKSDLI